MKIVQSFWSKPQSESLVEGWESRSHGGWVSDKYHFMSWAFSCLQLRKYYDEVELVTDREGKELLIDILGLPYTSVRVRLDDINEYDKDLWALGKIHAYSLQKQPFLHVDGDIYIWRPFDKQLMQSPVIGQHLEIGHKYYIKVMKMVDEHIPFIPQVIADYRRESVGINAVNTGLIGGNDIDFLQEYCREAMHFVNSNLDFFDRIDLGPFNTIYEQVLLYCMLRERKTAPGLFTRTVGEKFVNYELNSLERFRKAPYGVDMIHLFGGNKKKIMYCKTLAAHLKRYHPHYHDRIMDFTRVVSYAV